MHVPARLTLSPFKRSVFVFCTTLRPRRLHKAVIFFPDAAVLGLRDVIDCMTVRSACRGARALSTWKRARDEVSKE